MTSAGALGIAAGLLLMAVGFHAAVAKGEISGFYVLGLGAVLDLLVLYGVYGR